MPVPPKRIFQLLQQLGTSVVSLSNLRCLGIEPRQSCLERRTITMTCSYRLGIFSISSQIADSYGIMPLESLMRSTRSATGDIELDLGRYELRRQGQRVKL